MSAGTRRRLANLAGALGTLAGLGLCACVLLLLRDQVGARRRAQREAPVLAELQERAREESGAAEELNAKLVAEADLSLARRARRRALVPWLAASSVLLVLAFKLRQHLRGWSAPELLELQALRSAGEEGALAHSRGRELPRGVELAEVDAILDRTGRTAEAAIPVLNAIQAHWGYLPEQALRHVCASSAIGAAQIAGNASFYAHYRRTPVGRHLLRVCQGTACHVAGSQHVEEELRRHLAIPAEGDTDAARDFTVERVACLGCCSLAPVLVVDGHTAGRLTPERATRTVELLRPPVPEEASA